MTNPDAVEARQPAPVSDEKLREAQQHDQVLLLEVLNFITKVGSFEILISGQRNEVSEREVLRREANALYTKLDVVKWRKALPAPPAQEMK